MEKCLFYTLVTILLFSCIKDEDEIVGQDDIIRVMFETDTSNLFADNNSILLFKGIIPLDSKETFRYVTFAATDGLGEFQGTVKEKKNVVLADQAGIARSAIKIGTKPGIYFLSAEVTAEGKTFKSRDYLIRVKPQAQNSLIKLEIESDITNLRADNESIIKLKATTSPDNNGEIRTVTFIASQGLGQFKGTGSIIVANQDGVARANLEVGGTAGDYFLAAEVRIGDRSYRTDDLYVRLNAIPSNEKISLEVDTPSPAADGFSLVHITVNTKFTKDKTVALAANAGTFIQSSNPQNIILELDQQGIAQTEFRISSEEKPHIISATISETLPAIITLSPVISFPEILLVEPSSLTIETQGPPITLNTFLRKLLPDRMVTIGIPVGFRAYQVVNNQEVVVGRFNGLSTSISGVDGSVPPVNFFADSSGIDKNLPIIIEISVQKNETEKIFERVNLTVK